ncbi:MULTISPECIES: ExbD/TolR family protein [Sphingobacterium]|uniref:Biopolymer transporter ExbD n=1 Tax=Sphingobacterium cellulitidis TaxID=1768011 RepID=A0A8H9G2R8_9SPHI|nr:MULTISPECIES: biopolymer transporter ExbD [Sphingobacterium]MBA8988657.1 biopolymer transport protein ExbD [Sphingobacterium soli]OYD41931.1 biopolymer transporter ExbD [Sphingobacterium cellulitidis]OYD44807.1 biopolymer transporter ExbD [Sphingobacterium cellulitidis]WFB63345.1 biopolymer transporter ExbD [Sphingobacterium sp. WM]GGE34577.1 biopolymer transporter ExbD [Sphingobacterium soli]
MGKAKVKRASTAIDMTAMCDVSFLLLTFFVLTATARQPETLMVDTPASTTLDKLPDDNLAIITVGEQGKVFFTIKNPNVRERTLKNMSAKYSVPFSDEDYKKFKGLEDFGVPFKQLRPLLAQEPAKRTVEIQSGIPVDSTEALSNELYHWVQQARLATVEFNRDREAEEKNFTNPGPLVVAIKADAEEKYAVMNLIIETLRNQKQNKFSFVTGLRQEK